MSQFQPAIAQIPLSHWFNGALHPWHFRSGVWAAKWIPEARQSKCQQLDFRPVCTEIVKVREYEQAPTVCYSMDSMISHIS